MTKMMLGGLLLVAMFVAGGCASSSSGALRSGTARAVTATTSLPAPDTTTASGAYTGVPDYRIGALDLLQISVFQLEDLDREVRVNSSGMVSLPLIGAALFGGLTAIPTSRHGLHRLRRHESPGYRPADG